MLLDPKRTVVLTLNILDNKKVSGFSIQGTGSARIETIVQKQSEYVKSCHYWFYNAQQFWKSRFFEARY